MSRPPAVVGSLLECLEDLSRRSLLRHLPDALEVPGPLAIVEGRELVVMNGNDYLALSRHPRVIEAALHAVQEVGCSSTGSRLLSGNLALHEALERELAAFKRCETVTLFGSGYLANLGVLGALVRRGDHLVGDRLNHASLIDGVRSTGAHARHVRHGDLEAMERLLAAPCEGFRWIVVDGVFSMDGDVADLPALLELARRHDAMVILDEAHATGVLGATGRGSVEHHGLSGAPLDRLIQVGTLGKALGGYGAFVAGPSWLRSVLINRARTLIYSTALPPSVLAAAREAIAVVLSEPDRVQRLQARASRLREGLRKLGVPVPAGVTPIVPVPVGPSDRALELASRLREAGVLVQAIRPPTVPPGRARLRLTVRSDHDEALVDRVIRAFATERARAGPWWEPGTSDTDPGDGRKGEA